jgi:hypothetical protein
LPALWGCLRRIFGTAIAIMAVSPAAVYPIYYSQEFKRCLGRCRGALVRIQSTR